MLECHTVNLLNILIYESRGDEELIVYILNKTIPSYMAGSSASSMLMPLLAIAGTLLAFLGTMIAAGKLSKFLPKDIGRDYAHDGKLSAGKPRGAGIIFVLVFLVSVGLFGPLNREILFYHILIFAAMMTGFLDDAAKAPWGEYKKGLLDLLIAVGIAVNYLYFNGNEVNLAIFNVSFTIPIWLYGILIVLLIWTSINVTNCADGVDGLSGTLTIITLFSFFMANIIMPNRSVRGFGVNYVIILFVVCILGYLWYNATPSKLLMGDAGSRAMGLFIGITALKSGRPLLFILFAIVIILDGGLGLIKVTLLRFLKIHILKNTRTPLHDQVRKVDGWSNTQTVFRFAIIQIIVSAITIFLIFLH